VDNYIKVYKTYQARLTAPGLTSEECKTLLLDKECKKQDLELYKTVKHVVSYHDSAKGKNEYFCKWNGLNYEHCTWEPLEEICLIAREQLKANRQWEAEAKLPYKSVSYMCSQHPPFEKIMEDPESITKMGGHRILKPPECLVLVVTGSWAPSPTLHAGLSGCSASFLVMSSCTLSTVVGASVSRITFRHPGEG